MRGGYELNASRMRNRSWAGLVREGMTQDNPDRNDTHSALSQGSRYYPSHPHPAN